MKGVAAHWGKYTESLNVYESADSSTPIDTWKKVEKEMGVSDRNDREEAPCRRPLGGREG